MIDRLDAVELAQDQQGKDIVALQTQMLAVAKAIEANTAAISDHTKILSEYNGARKLIHWALTAAAALGAYIFGKSVHTP